MSKRDRNAREDRAEKALFELEQAGAKPKEPVVRDARRQGALPFQFEAEPDGDEVTAWSGLTLIVEMMKRLGVEESAKLLDTRQRDAGFSMFEVLTGFVLLRSFVVHAWRSEPTRGRSTSSAPT
jgi:hypothetical protein